MLVVDCPESAGSVGDLFPSEAFLRLYTLAFLLFACFDVELHLITMFLLPLHSDIPVPTFPQITDSLLVNC